MILYCINFKKCYIEGEKSVVTEGEKKNPALTQNHQEHVGPSQNKTKQNKAKQKSLYPSSGCPDF